MRLARQEDSTRRLFFPDQHEQNLLQHEDNSSCSTRLLNGLDGCFTAKEVLDNINNDDVHLPRTSLVSIENTCNKGGGTIYDIKEIEKIASICNYIFMYKN